MKILMLLTCVSLFSCHAFVWAAESDSEKGYGGTPWGISFRQFQSQAHSESLDLMDKIGARAMDYVLMDFHEVPLDDPARPKKFSVRKKKGDDVSYVFYDGKYCMASVPIAEVNVEAVQKKINQNYKPLGVKTYQSYLEFEGGDYGWEMLDLEYAGFSKNPETRVYLVKASTYFENVSASSKSAGEFLIYISTDYVEKNAYKEWRLNKSAAPVINQEKAEKRELEDVGHVE